MQLEENTTLVGEGSNNIEIKTKAAKRSGLINSFIIDFPEAEIPLEQISYPILVKIKEYLEHYEDKEPNQIAQPLPKKDFKDCVDDWDYNFINLDNETIFEIMLAANFMDIQPLLDLTSAKIASEIKGKNEEQIRRLFHMEKDDEDDNIENLQIAED